MDATIAALAGQGLERCQSEIRRHLQRSRYDARNQGAIPDLLKDPFLSTDSAQAKPALADLGTAMPWLSSAVEPRAMPTSDTSPYSAPFPSPEPTLSSEAHSGVEMANKKTVLREEKPPKTLSSPHPRSLQPRSSWRIHGSADNFNLQSKAPPTRLCRWG